MKSKIVKSEEELLERKKTILRLKSFALAASAATMGYLGLTDNIIKANNQKDINQEVLSNTDDNNSCVITDTKQATVIFVGDKEYFVAPVGYTLDHGNVCTRSTAKVVSHQPTYYFYVKKPITIDGETVMGNPYVYCLDYETAHNIASLASFVNECNNNLDTDELSNVFAPTLVRTKQ